MENNNSLIGYSGFVGGNLLMQQNFTSLFNSKNIKAIEGNSYNEIICCGVNAKKWWANENPKEDRKNIHSLMQSLEKVTCKQFVLISTIDVYKNPICVNENTDINLNLLDPYGYNRYEFEEFIKNKFDNSLILRLPALFGKGLKKNFIYDLVNPLPQIIKNDKYLELNETLSTDDIAILNRLYKKDDFSNFTLKSNGESDIKKILINSLKSLNFTSHSFTDYRSTYQFYSLKNLIKDINLAAKNNINLINISTEPISSSELALEVFNIDFKNTIQGKSPATYDFRSIHSNVFNDSTNGYLYSKNQVLNDIKDFIKKEYNYETRNI